MNTVARLVDADPARAELVLGTARLDLAVFLPPDGVDEFFGDLERADRRAVVGAGGDDVGLQHFLIAFEQQHVLRFVDDDAELVRGHLDTCPDLQFFLIDAVDHREQIGCDVVFFSDRGERVAFLHGVKHRVVVRARRNELREGRGLLGLLRRRCRRGGSSESFRGRE